MAALSYSAAVAAICAALDLTATPARAIKSTDNMSSNRASAIGKAGASDPLSSKDTLGSSNSSGVAGTGRSTTLGAADSSTDTTLGTSDITEPSKKAEPFRRHHRRRAHAYHRRCGWRHEASGCGIDYSGCGTRDYETSCGVGRDGYASDCCADDVSDYGYDVGDCGSYGYAPYRGVSWGYTPYTIGAPVGVAVEYVPVQVWVVANPWPW